MSVGFKIQALERQIAMEREQRNAKLSLYFFQQKQKKLFPGAQFGTKQIEAVDFLNFTPIILDDKAVIQALQSNIMKISGNNLTFTRQVIEYIGANLKTDAIDFLNRSWEDVKKAIASYRNSTVSYLTFSRLLESYVTKNYFDFNSNSASKVPNEADAPQFYDTTQDPVLTESEQSIKLQISNILEPAISSNLMTQADFDYIVDAYSLDDANNIVPYANQTDVVILSKILDELKKQVEIYDQAYKATIPIEEVKRQDIRSLIEKNGFDSNVKTLDIITVKLYGKPFDELDLNELDTFLQDLTNDFKGTYLDTIAIVRKPNQYLLYQNIVALSGAPNLTQSEVDLVVSVFFQEQNKKVLSLSPSETATMLKDLRDDPNGASTTIKQILIQSSIRSNNLSGLPSSTPKTPTPPLVPGAAVDYTQLKDLLNPPNLSAESTIEKRAKVIEELINYFNDTTLFTAVETTDINDWYYNEIMVNYPKFPVVSASIQKNVLAEIKNRIETVLVRYENATSASASAPPASAPSATPPASAPASAPATPPPPPPSSTSVPDPTLPPATTTAKGLFILKHSKKKPAGFRGGSADLQANMKDKFFVDIKNLNENYLKLKYRSFNTPVPNFATVKISDKVKQVVLQIIHNHKKDANKDYAKLEPDEKKIIKKFCSIIECELIDDIVNSKENLFKKYEILSGEINAGNDSVELRQMLKSVVVELYDFKYITKHQYLDVLSMIE